MLIDIYCDAQLALIMPECNYILLQYYGNYIYNFVYSFPCTVNPIFAGVLENQYMLGGGQFDTPPPLNPMFDVQI